MSDLYTHICVHLKASETVVGRFPKNSELPTNKFLKPSTSWKNWCLSGTKRAKKIARKVNQAESLKEFAQITPRLNNFVIELRQERIFRGGWSVESQNPEIYTAPHAHSVRVKPDLHAPFSGQDSKVVKGPKKVSSNPVPKRSS